MKRVSRYKATSYNASPSETHTQLLLAGPCLISRDVKRRDGKASSTKLRRDPAGEENDKLIGWPDPLKEEAEDKPVYDLRLTGFGHKSKNEIMEALYVLAKHGIRLKDLNAGHAHGPESMAEAHKAKELFFKDPCIEGRWTTAMNRYQATTMLRVGANFVDVEVPDDARSAHIYTSHGCELMANEKWPRRRLREMRRGSGMVGDEKSALASSASVPNTPSIRIYRIFVGNFVDEYLQHQIGRLHSVLDALEKIEHDVFDKWRNEYNTRKQKELINVAED